MTADRPNPDGPRQPDYGDGGRAPETLVAEGAQREERSDADAAADSDKYRAPEEGGEGPPADETPDGEPMEPLAPVPEGEEPPFTDPFGPSG